MMTAASVKPIQHQFAEDIDLLSLDQLEATPVGPRQNFFVDLWNAMMPFKINKRIPIGSASSNELIIKSLSQNKLKINALRIANTDSVNQLQGKSVLLNPSALFQEISQGIVGRYFEKCTFKIRLKDGLLILEDGPISYVAGALERYTLPKQVMLEELLAVVFLAKCFQVDHVTIARGLERFYQHGTRFGEIRSFHNQRFFNCSSLQMWDQVVDVLKYFMGEIHIITPTHCQEIPELIQQKLMNLHVKWIAVSSQNTSMQKTPLGLDVVKVPQVRRAIQRSFEWAETPASVFYLSGIESKDKECRKREHEFVREVLSW